MRDCEQCGKIFYSHRYRGRKNCSKACSTIAVTRYRTYQNGSRKTTWFFNPYENKEVLLESSWEVRLAEFLIDNNIEWIRPPSMSWTDKNNVERLYWPDFYLPKYDLYLDPKNPYCMERDKDKLEALSKSIKLLVGNVEEIIDQINDLLNEQFIFLSG